MIAAVWTHARRLFDETKGVVLACGLVLVAQTAIGQPFMIPSGSMEPTLLIGDEIAAAKYAYGYGRYSAPVGTLPMNGRVFDRAPDRGDRAGFGPGEGGVGSLRAEYLIGRVDRVLLSISPNPSWLDVLAAPTTARLSRLWHPVR